MPIEIKVAPPGITISQGRTFMVTDGRGEINPHGDEGVYAIDTRFISDYRLFINQEPWVLVNSSQLTFYAARFYLTNPRISTEDGDFGANTISLTIERTVEEGIHEDFYVTNYTGKKIRFNLQLALRSDFADLFEVKAKRLVERGRMLTEWDTKERRLRTSYEHHDFHRAVTYWIPNIDVSVGYANGHVFFEIELEPGQEWHTCGELILEHGQQVMVPAYGHRSPGQLEEPLSAMDELQARWLASSPQLLTPNDDLYRVYRQAIEDMGALRIYDLDVSAHEWVPDEMRFGELAHFHAIPHTPYFGTADATMLYLIALSETYQWTGDSTLLKEYRKVAEACLDWIDHYGDFDGDGFQEYKTFSSLGYENVNWKDSGDSVVYADGSQVKQPKGTCELQGYVYDAKVRMAEVFSVLGDEARAQALLQQAETLQRNFNAVYWMEQEGCYAYGQDGDKKLITSIASNAGHCLWSGIAYKEKAQSTARRLLQDDMWSGWGIRTLSSKNPAYNPYSYHLGSIWPHDNGIIAAGFKRYGLANEANQVIHAIFDAARCFEAYRLPEIFAGVSRKGKKTDFPALYPPGANVPQAWASGSVFQMMQTILGLRADAPHNRLYVDPTLPEWLPELQLQHLRVGSCSFTLHFWREGERSRWEVVQMIADQDVAQPVMVQVMDEPQRAS